MNPQTNQKTTKKSTKNQPKWLQNRSWRLSWAPLGASWGVLGPSWRQAGPKNQKSGNLEIKVTPLGGQLGSQIPPKIVLEAFQKVIIFSIGFGVGFWWHLVPTWLQLGHQNFPQIDPRWFQDPSKIGSRCRPIFCLIFDRPGIVFFLILLRSWTAEGPKKLFKV